MSVVTTPRFFTIGQLASELNEPTHRVLYAIASRGIQPAFRAADRFRIFDGHGAQAVARAIREIDMKGAANG